MIENLLTWFRENIYPRSSESPDDLQRTGVRAGRPLQQALRSQAASKSKAPASTRKGAPTEIDPDDLVYDGAVDSEIEDLGPGKNVLKRSKYVREDAGTHETLKIIEEGSIEVAEDDGGIDPYNTGQFDRSETWNKRFRK